MSDKDEKADDSAAGRDALDRRMEGSDLTEAMSAAIGITTRSLHTIWASMVHTPRVIESVLRKAPDYTPPIPLFLALFAVQLAMAALFGLPGAPTTDLIRETINDPALLEAWLASSSASEAEINAVIQQAYDYALWPIAVFGALPYIALLWAFRPSRSLFSHTLIYFITINASFGVIFLGLPFSLIWPETAPITALIASFGMYYVATARALRAFYAQSWWGVSWRMAIFLIVLLPSLFVIQWLMFAAIDLGLAPFDLSITDLFVDDFLSSANPESAP